MDRNTKLALQEAINELEGVKVIIQCLIEEDSKDSEQATHQITEQQTRSC